MRREGCEHSRGKVAGVEIAHFVIGRGCEVRRGEGGRGRSSSERRLKRPGEVSICGSDIVSNHVK